MARRFFCVRPQQRLRPLLPARYLAQSDPPGTTPPPRDWDDPSTALYPDPAFEVFDKRFAKYSGGTAGLVRIWTGGVWTEGPVWFGDMHSLIWSDIPNNRLMRHDTMTKRTTLFRQPSTFANGNTRDRQGRLLSCEQGTRSVTRTEYDGTITVVADKYQGKPLNSPNGVIVKSDDTVWFTDPSYGILGDHEGNRGESELSLRSQEQRAHCRGWRLQHAERTLLLPERKEALHYRHWPSRRP